MRCPARAPTVLIVELSVYDGEYLDDDLPHGLGVYRWADGDIYEG